MGSVVDMSPILALKSEMLKHEQIELPTEHIFHGGMYCRQMFQPAGTIVLGKVHRSAHFFQVVSGTLQIGTECVEAPCLMTCEPGVQRALYALTDALYMTIHRTDATTVEQAEAELVEPDPDSPFLVGNTLPKKALT